MIDMQGLTLEQSIRYNVLNQFGDRAPFAALDNMFNYILNGDIPPPVTAPAEQQVDAKPLEVAQEIVEDTGSANR